MNNLTQRILTGVVGAAVIIFLLCWHAWSLTILFLLLAMFTQFEFLRVVNKLKERQIVLPIFMATCLPVC